ncbi:MAG: hypothetical protein QOI31_114 [Solirubrobacterales bacterium]|nr:hypothetical protein [Solirubrobacterales bacterium]
MLNFAQQLDKAAALPLDTQNKVRELAKQINHKAVLPLVGAGASFDCGSISAKDLAHLVARSYRSLIPDTATHPSDLASAEAEGALGVVADALFHRTTQEAVVDALSLDDTGVWPGVDDFPEHFCPFRVLARLAREGLLPEAITLNYDQAFERGLQDEGFQFAPSAARGRRWLDHASVIADREANASIERRGAFALTKAHGCVAEFRRRTRNLARSRPPLARTSKRGPWDSIVVRRGQLLDWRTDFWARDVLADRSRRNVILLLGFSGSDPVINATLTRILDEVAAGGTAPRVVVIDHCPDTVALEGLIDAGRGRGVGLAGVEVIGSGGTTMTAILLALAAEWVSLRLKPAAQELGIALPSAVSELVPELSVAAPCMLRWSYQLAPLDAEVDLAQDINLERAARKGYVPLTVFPFRTARLLAMRRSVRSWLGLSSPETVTEATRHGSFVVDRGSSQAYLPVDIKIDRLRSIPPSTWRRAAETMDAPRDLDWFLVARDGNDLVGLSLMGAEVRI